MYGYDDLTLGSPYDDTLADTAGTVFLMRGEGPQTPRASHIVRRVRPQLRKSPSN